MAVITFGPTYGYAGASRVYVRARWADSWTLAPSMVAERLAWSLWPSIPVAEITFRYGPFMAEGSSTWANVAKLDYLGYYVKIEADCEDGTLVWVGFVDEIVDYQGATGVSVPTGTQRFVCFAISHVLGFERLLRSKFWNGTAAQLSGSAIAFNAGGVGNRTATIPSGQASHLFEPNELVSEFWSSRDIANYLIAQHSPTDKDGTKKITWVLQNATLLPDWDSPEIIADGATVWDILNQLLNRRLFLSAWDGYDAVNNECDINVVSLAQSTIDLGNGNSLSAAASQHSIVCQADPATTAVVQRSASGRYHQVVARSAKRTSTGTFDVGGNYSGLYKSWSPAEATEYVTGATTEPGYSALDSYSRAKRNAAARETAKLEHVFRTLELRQNDDWLQDGEPLFPPPDLGSGLVETKPYFPLLTILPELPFWVGVDYTGNEIANGVDTTNASPIKRRPMVCFENPAVATNPPFVRVDSLGVQLLMGGVDDDVFFSVDPQVDRKGKAISLNVNGGHQHFISGSIFPLEDIPVSKWVIDTTVATITLEEDRYSEAVSPATLSTTVDAIRRIVLDFGDAFRRDYVVPFTAVDVNGSLQLSDGGYIRDDYEKLQSAANAAALYYVRERAILRLTTSRPLTALRVGDLITTLNASTPHAATINTTISEITLQLGDTENGPSPIPQFSIVTANSELDPLIFNPVTFGQ